jgi:hypothetical protein
VSICINYFEARDNDDDDGITVNGYSNLCFRNMGTVGSITKATVM